MLELSDSTPPVRPSIAALLNSPAEPEPPADDWERQPALREVFLMHFTRPEDRAALEHLGSMLYESALEMSDKWPDWKENPTRAELRAVALDLRHCAAFLASVGKEREFSSLEGLEETLTIMAAEWGVMVARIAWAIDSVLPDIPVRATPDETPQ
jgi:hypothetical protein